MQPHPMYRRISMRRLQATIMTHRQGYITTLTHRYSVIVSFSCLLSMSHGSTAIAAHTVSEIASKTQMLHLTHASSLAKYTALHLFNFDWFVFPVLLQRVDKRVYVLGRRQEHVSAGTHQPAGKRGKDER